MNCRKDLRAELAAMEPKLASSGRRYWKSLEELAESAEFQHLMQREFPNQASVWPDSLSRRNFLTLMSASLAMAGLGGCSVKPAPREEIVPYVRSPEEIVPGKPLYYATTMTLDGGGVGLLVETHMGRPTKIEGSPDHPASLGATNVLHQASVLSLYDPDRSQTVKYRGQTRTWDDAIAAIRTVMQQQRTAQGASLRLLTETIVSPTLQEQIDRLLTAFPAARWHVWEPLQSETVQNGAKRAFGRVVARRFDFAKADVVVSLDDDFMVEGPAAVRYAADFMNRRRVRNAAGDAKQAEMNRLYVVESSVTCTGAKADHRLAVKCSDIEGIARALALEVGTGGANGANNSASDISSNGLSAQHEKWVRAVASDLQNNRGRCLVVAGRRQPEAVHVLVHALNDRLGNVGNTVEYIEPIELPQRSQPGSLGELAKALTDGSVETLIILGSNPVYTAPADLQFADCMGKAGMRIHCGLYEDETAQVCDWHLPETHYLESWSDSRAYDGTASIVQPVIEPLYQGRSLHELLAMLSDEPRRPGREIVRDHWRKAWRLENNGDEFERRWQTALHNGVIADSRFSARTVSLANNWMDVLRGDNSNSSSASRSSQNQADANLELEFLADPSIYDGRFANNGWLQELPKPMTKLAWGNAAIISPTTAERWKIPAGSYAHGGEHGGYHMPVVRLQIGERAVEAPVWIMPGQADDTVTVWLGFGREAAGSVGGKLSETVGFDAYRLRTSGQEWFATGLSMTVLDRTELVACTQAHHSMEGRETVRAANLDKFRSEPNFVSVEQLAEAHDRLERATPPLNFYEPYKYDPPKNKWGMVIDLTTCFGCNACVAACQAENNIPVVGKEQVAKGREMHWLRVDRYLEGPAEEPDAFYFQPLPCMHCENAPCEYVCPVEATVHSAEGLNDMIYNRCVGTRFCSNNCPYKVRRFNFLAYSDFESPGRRMQYNPDVTVRSRGVMEKCTYCVQRIRQAQIGAETEGRSIADGEVLTACQAVCPTQAIVFGDMNDANSKVKQWKESPLHYGLLEDLNTVPRTTYLAELRNPNPELT